ncbi:LuxR family quorum sensing-dependent transcriptional regulator [Bradyrhizobium sp. USDA 4501]
MQRTALEFVEKVETLTSADAVMDQFGAALRYHGIENYMFSFIAVPVETLSDVTLASRVPAGLLDTYNERDLVHHDPGLRHALRTALPFRWFKEAPFDPEAEPLAQEAVNVCRDFGLTDGMVFPFITSAGRMGQAWIGGATLDVPKLAMPPLHMMTFYAFDSVLQLKGAGTSALVSLTAREHEMLTRHADGATAEQIADAVNLSERTVREHLNNCKRKLGATTLSQTVAIATRQRMI